jgi:uncharacterized protein YdeI (BOF family)
MKTLAAAFALALLSGPALAQATPPASTPSPSTAPTTTTATENQSAATSTRDGRPGRGAYIKMQGPGGSEITVRCADGESTRACAEVVGQLIERARTSSAERRRDWGGDRDSTRSGEMRGGGEGRGYRGERDRDF